MTIPNQPGPGLSRFSGTAIGSSVTLALGVVLLGFALTVDFPAAAQQFHSDESTYYMMGHSLARDFDLIYQRTDLARVWEEFDTGPQGVFLKQGKEVNVELTGRFPFVQWRTSPEQADDRLYWAKAYIYPLVAAPFVRLFGTNGFLVLHALLLTLAFGAAYAFLAARSGPWTATLYAGAFVVGSVVPVYFVWISPELFNLTLAVYALFLWSYKEVAPAEARGRGRLTGMLRSPVSDYLAAAIVGMLFFSKPPHLAMMLPLMALPLWRRQWRRALISGLVFLCVGGGLFLGNVAITGEFNYQGGDRKTFYGGTASPDAGVSPGFPFLTPSSTFETVGLDRGTDRVLTEIVFTPRDVLYVFRHNLWYFMFGRHTGLVPYFFPGIFTALLFLSAPRRRPVWQWLVLVALVAAAVGLLLWLPFTYSGGGAPIGNRYYIAYYPLFLFLVPPLASVLPALGALAIGSLFTAQLVLNPFHTSIHPDEHPQSGVFRWFPVELSLLNDLPVMVTDRARIRLAGDPPMLAYFLDTNAYKREGEWFWVKGKSRAEVILRGAVRERADRRFDSLEIATLNVEIRSGDVSNRVTLDTGRSRQVLDMGPQETRAVTLEMPAGFPYHAFPELPTSYVYRVGLESETGFTPMFTEQGSRDSRYLGAMVRLEPVYRIR